MTDLLNNIFEELGVKERSKLGNAAEEEIRRNQAQLAFAERRKEIQVQLSNASRARSQAMNRLNIAFYLIIGLIVVSILVQFFVKGSNIILFVQTACTAVLFPISRQIDQGVTKQAYLEFVAAFLPDLEPKEAIKAIDQLYQAMSNPNSVKGSVNTSTVLTQ
jgi:Flp pilus assembly protein TadB